MLLKRIPPERNIISPVSAWCQALRVPYFTAVIIPVIFSTCYALWTGVSVDWPALPLTLLGLLFIHGGTNCINDYYDHKNGIDKKETFGSSRVLVDGLMRPQHLWTEGMLLFSFGALIGVLIAFWRGPLIIILGLLGILGGYFYSAKPLGLKYIAWGDAMVFLLFGPILTGGVFFALTATHSWQILLASLPLAALTSGILSANNTRDMHHDKTANIKTVALTLGLKGAKIEYAGLLIGAYFGVPCLILTGLLPWQSLVALISLPLAFKNISLMIHAKHETLATLLPLPVETARLHMIFGIILTIAVFAAIPR